jgi:hypothetical protein
MISDLNNAVLTAVVDGSMQTFIWQEGATQSVGKFSTVNVIANSALPTHFIRLPIEGPGHHYRTRKGAVLCSSGV